MLSQCKSAGLLSQCFDIARFQFTPNGNATTTYRIRVVPLEGNPFLALDTARALDLKTNSGGVEHHLRKLGADEKRLVTPQQVRGIRNKAYAVSESGLYKLIMRSDKPQAGAFRIGRHARFYPPSPSAGGVRKTGGYVLQGADPATVGEDTVAGLCFL